MNPNEEGTMAPPPVAPAEPVIEVMPTPEVKAEGEILSIEPMPEAEATV